MKKLKNPKEDELDLDELDLEELDLKEELDLTRGILIGFVDSVVNGGVDRDKGGVNKGVGGVK